MGLYGLKTHGVVDECKETIAHVREWWHAQIEGKAMQQKYVKAYGCWYTAHQPISGCSKASTRLKVIF